MFRELEDYDIVQEIGLFTFKEAMIKKVKEGWVPTGNFFRVEIQHGDYPEFVYTQGIVLPKKTLKDHD